MIDENLGVVGSTSGSMYLVRVLSTLNKEDLKPNARVALHRSSHSIVDILPADTDAAVQMMKMTEKSGKRISKTRVKTAGTRKKHGARSRTT